MVKAGPTPLDLNYPARDEPQGPARAGFFSLKPSKTIGYIGFPLS
jgi:hypothetical protein